MELLMNHSLKHRTTDNHQFSVPLSSKLDINPSIPKAGWRSDAWIVELAKQLLRGDGLIKINRKSKRDEHLWFPGTDHLDLARVSFSRWLDTQEIELLDSLTSILTVELHGLCIRLKNEEALRQSFGLLKKEDSFRTQTIALLQQQGFSDSDLLDLSSCLTGSALSPKSVALGIKQLRDGTFTSRRAASAQCFCGDSKFLDGRDILLEKLGQSHLKSSPLLINVKLPTTLNDVLFIENLDTFSLFCEQDRFEISGTALVYSKGFAASAQRLTQASGRRLFTMGDGDSKIHEAFESFLNGDLALPAFLFGDLDWAGLSIYECLKKNFPGLELWEEGYVVLERVLKMGGGHTAIEAKKEGQNHLEVHLLTNSRAIELAALLAFKNRFVDQETFSFAAH